MKNNPSVMFGKEVLHSLENRLFLSDLLQLYPQLQGKSYIEKFQAKVAYQEFYNHWVKTKEAKRDLLIPFFKEEKRLILIYLLSFLGLNNFHRFLKMIGKDV